MEPLSSPQFWENWVRIILIDLALAGDNAVVIALAVRTLPARQRLWGRVFGSLGAVALRIVLISLVTELLRVPWLKLVCGVLLLGIAWKLAQPRGSSHEGARQGTSLHQAIGIIMIADVVMSLDNVIAIAGAAEAADPQHRIALVIFGLIVSIPLIVWGSTLVLKLLDRFPVIVTIGAALLGWIAGGLIINDPAGDRWPLLDSPAAEYGAKIAGALIVVIVGYALKRRTRRREHESPSR